MSTSSCDRRQGCVKEALSAAASLGDEVRAATVCHPDPEDRAGGETAAAGPGTRVTVLIPEVEPDRLWQRLLRNQRVARSRTPSRRARTR